MKDTMDVASLDSTCRDGDISSWHVRGQKNGHSPSDKSRGGWTIKLHMVAADDRRPVSFGGRSPSPRWTGGAQTAQPAGATTGNASLRDVLRIFEGTKHANMADIDMEFTKGFSTEPLKSRVDPWEYDKELVQASDCSVRNAQFRRLKGSSERVFTR